MTTSRRAGASDLALYSRTAQRSSGRVIREYSTSFGMATLLLEPRVRGHIRNVYALVRVADEIVDGAATEAGLDTTALRALLDGLEEETERALQTGYSANLVVHSFAVTARMAGIEPVLTRPFFASMRRDLDTTAFTAGEVPRYIYGSAEVVGLMCLRVFLAGVPCEPGRRSRLEHGARCLGAAFQKINFLRDLATDWNRLKRNYFPGINPERITETQKLAIIADIVDDLDAAVASIPELPRGCRAAVLAAHGLFCELTRHLRATPAADLLRVRVRVPTARKLLILARTTRPRMARTMP